MVLVWSQLYGLPWSLWGLARDLNGLFLENNGESTPKEDKEEAGEWPAPTEALL
jgi:hypothetical protein